MGSAIVSVIVLLILLHTTVGAFEWNTSLPAGGLLEVCEGDNVTLPWAVRLADGERVASFDYHSQLSYRPSENTGQDHIDDGVPIDVVTADSRFKFGPGHQLQINHVVVNDTGNYTLKVKVTRDKRRKQEQYSSKIYLLVKASPRTGDNSLQASQETRAVHVTSGPQPGWHLQLSCGTFLTLGHPPVTVTWKTPGGITLPSTFYENDSFSLLLDNPVETGLYTCRVDKQAPALGCVDRGARLLNATGGVYVDHVEARIMFLEAANVLLKTRLIATDTGVKSTLGQLKNENNVLKSAIKTLENNNSHFNTRMEGLSSESRDLKEKNSKLETAVKQLRNENSALKTSLQRLQDTARQMNESLKQAADGSIAELNSSIQQVKTKNDVLKTSQEQLTVTVGQLRTEDQAVRTILKQMEVQASALQNRTLTFERKLTQPARPVSFYARARKNFNTKHFAPVILSNVVTNQARAYDPNTGTFTAPIEGTYFLAATAGFYQYNAAAFEMMAESYVVCQIYVFNGDNEYDTSTCVATIRLKKGEKVWLRALGDAIFWSKATAFTGFLIGG